MFPDGYFNARFVPGRVFQCPSSLPVFIARAATGNSLPGLLPDGYFNARSVPGRVIDYPSVDPRQ
jgi:hypothetical protein